MKVDCAAIPAESFERDFFGCVSTDTTARDEPGRLEAADGGTLFHDHIAELPDALQAKLARPLQDATFERVGDSRTRRADVRYIAATNRDLSEQVSQGHFRQDVYFRVSVFPVEVPPLRTRPEDIPVLVEHFLAAPGSTRAGSMPRLTDAQRDHLQTYDWPGNVRELVDFVESLRGDIVQN